MSVAPASAAPIVPATGPSVFPAAPATPAPAPELSSPTVLVKTASEAVAQAVAARHGLTVSRGFPWIGWYELATPPGTTDATPARDALSHDADVEATDTVAPGETVQPQFTPRDPAWDPGAVLQTGEQAQWQLAKANFPAAWDRSTGANASIGIIDSEFDTNHPDLQAKVRNPYNVSSGSAQYHTGDVQAQSPNELHGTHVAGIAAAVTDNGVGVSGAGFDATFVPVKINTSFNPGNGNPVDSNFVADLTEALGYIANQPVSVVTMSLGGTRPHQPLADAIAAVRAKGIPVIASAGNFQQTNPNAAIYPASYPGVIAIANTQADDTIAPSSSNGNWVDVAAPGTNIFSTWDARDPKMSFNGSAGNYNVETGTSMSAPLVAGLVALMKSIRPDLTPDEVEAILKGTARDLGSAGPDPQFGAGRIDASAAVNAAASYVRPVPPPAPAPIVTPPAPAPPRDTVAPKVTIAGLVTVAGRSVTVRFKCNEACKGTARVRSTKRKLLASKSFTGKAGKTVTVHLKTKKKLKARSTVIVEIAAKDGTGNLATKAERRKLRR
ncbi:MAG TPA: S8 family serine peptidase [Baekduia sp.]|uniref:S8 family peptidase n=1 Tax=Baekduia sp. TaxID=2600305 RepID=UPI002D773648|nr:S8 family serine peptidase [Baekduia sp.]HET6506553.1 S8 family serine peptidase [Baekduia sp.]